MPAFIFGERSIADQAGNESLILPTASDISRYAPPLPPEDDFLTEDHNGLPCVTHPVGIRESSSVADKFSYP